MSQKSKKDAPEKKLKSGFVVIAGAPNAGKSTFLNRVLGQKISITSRKPQTTRDRILGVARRPGSQVVFIDTPGVHRATRALNVKIVAEAVSAMSDVDMALMLADVSAPDPESEGLLTKNLKAGGKPVVLALNKMDRLKKPELASRVETWRRGDFFKAVLPISARHGDGVEELLQIIEDMLPEGPAYFPEETLTDKSERFMAAEIIREKVFRLTGKEIPYSTAVTVESFKREKKLTRIEACVHVEHDSQKGIIIGKKGAKLKQIGSDARKDLERMAGQKVFLKLFVRVEKNWSRDPKAMRRLGY
ncbi:GTPase Era [Candidatus Desulfarcum epimagneticum]|uniref:GTPase Era n=1 Tax=uncultured Desulfobacteraceae bacterium TaxID=218296 RepID=A0A484HM83_9BACT|nr:GTPase Era [uncultured Desulfobacteraceae bacterium]